MRPICTNKAANFFRLFMLELGLDPEKDEHLKDTPIRFAKHICEQVKNYGVEPSLTESADYDSDKELKVTTFDATDVSELVVVTNISFSSICAHHLSPFFGKAHIGYLPNRKMIGLSKMPRLLDFYCARPQTQELLTNQVAEKLREITDANFVGVILEAEHTCVSCRGVRKIGSITKTSKFWGGHIDTRQEFIKLAIG